MAVMPESIACIVLAAGRSERFGARDKMAALLDGRPLLHHALSLFDGFAFARKLVVCRPEGPAAEGFDFERVEIARPRAQQSDSLRAGLALLDSHDLHGVLIALGDMPRVGRRHVERLLDRFDPGDPLCAVASVSNGRRSPPALFGIGHLPALAAIEGDRGARGLLASALPVVADRDELLDVDTCDDLSAVPRHG